MVTIKGKNYESFVVTESDTTFVVDEKAELFSGGVASEDNTFYGYGLIEDASASPDGNTYKINGHVSGVAGGILTSGINTTIRVGKGADVISATSIFSGGDGSSPFGVAIMASGENSKVSIAKGAEIAGFVGIAIGGSDSTATNSGLIQSGFMGMTAGMFSGAGNLADVKLVNNGRIEGSMGMVSHAVDGVILENGKNGEIVAFAIGMGVDPQAASSSSTINNFGTIRVTISFESDFPPGTQGLLNTAAAIVGGFGADTVRNTGKIVGDIGLSAGNDILDNRGGTIKGDIFGGLGDDTLVAGKAGDKLIEFADEGTDTVKSAFTYALTDFVENLVLTGKNDINATGNDLDNVLIGNKGDNVLTGGAGIDTFVFGSNGGKDRIADFSVADDVLDLGGWAGMTEAVFGESVTEKNGALWIKLDGGKDVLILADHVLADLDAATIIYALA